MFYGAPDAGNHVLDLIVRQVVEDRKLDLMLKVLLLSYRTLAIPVTQGTEFWQEMDWEIAHYDLDALLFLKAFFLANFLVGTILYIFFKSLTPIPGAVTMLIIAGLAAIFTIFKLLQETW